VKNEGDYFKSGLNYGKRNNCLSLQVMPSDMIFTDEGQAVFATREDDGLFVCGLLNTRLYRYVINTFCGQHKHSGYLNSLPMVPVSERIKQRLADHVIAEWRFRQACNSREETGNWFADPIDGPPDSLLEISRRRLRRELLEEIRLLHERIENENELFDGLQFSDDDRTAVVNAFSGFPLGMANEVVTSDSQLDELADDELDEEEVQKPQFSAEQYGAVGLYCQRFGVTVEQLGDEQVENSILASTRTDVSREVVAYALGCAYGRWDIRYALGQCTRSASLTPFDLLPICSPGMLKGDAGIPETSAPIGYPFRINGDGILVDDAEHRDDIERRVRDFLELIWKKRAEAIEKEACEILGVKELRDYFRKPGKGGFWDDHVARYSKSRRKAPIYWLLQSSKKNYALWLYYHRLDKDLLFKALMNYVEPKIRLEADRLRALRSDKAAAGDSGKEAKRLAKDIERQEDLLSEIRDFEDRLRRAANLHLEPDLNDGVVLNIAPLHELVPWKQAQNYWDELLKGKYEWSSIGKQLRQKGLVK
jgi:hypothetical protein